MTPLAAARLRTKTVPSWIDYSRIYEYNAPGYDNFSSSSFGPVNRNSFGAACDAPALNALWDEYLWQLLRAWISVRGPQVGTSARHAVASTPELSRQVVAFLVGVPSIHA